MRALLVRLFGLRALAAGAAVVAFATAASASSLTVYTTDTANNLKNVFVVGETFHLTVTGDEQTNGPAGQDSFAVAQAFWDAALTTTIILPVGCNGSSASPCTSATQGNWFQDKGSMGLSDGSAYLINQQGARTAVQIDTSFVTLVADAIGSTSVAWGGTLIAFFDIYYYDDPINVPTGHSFTIVPEPATAALLGLSLLGLAGWRRVSA